MRRDHNTRRAARLPGLVSQLVSTGAVGADADSMAIDRAELTDLLKARPLTSDEEHTTFSMIGYAHGLSLSLNAKSKQSISEVEQTHLSAFELDDEVWSTPQPALDMTSTTDEREYRPSLGV